jgi:16S rRNA U516 pseudouridylate synthase RsuA-like enzyme
VSPRGLAEVPMIHSVKALTRGRLTSMLPTQGLLLLTKDGKLGRVKKSFIQNM